MDMQVGWHVLQRRGPASSASDASEGTHKQLRFVPALLCDRNLGSERMISSWSAAWAVQAMPQAATFERSCGSRMLAATFAPYCKGLRHLHKLALMNCARWQRLQRGLLIVPDLPLLCHISMSDETRRLAKDTMACIVSIVETATPSAIGQ